MTKLARQTIAMGGVQRSFDPGAYCRGQEQAEPELAAR
jgi:hypothetical protein